MHQSFLSCHGLVLSLCHGFGGLHGNGCAEAEQRLQEVVVAVAERCVDLRVAGLVSDAVLEQPVTNLVAFREVGG